ncbi:MAG: glucuronate isomerase [Trueperaceae bacterium]
MTMWQLDDNRCFSAEPLQRNLARALYESIKDLPLVCPHGHVDPNLLANPHATFGSPSELFVIPDHYIFRMLYSQGVRLEDLGISTRDGTPVEGDHRKIWQRFAENFYLFRGTPTGLWLKDELINVFDIRKKLTAETADEIYDELSEKLAQPDFTPRALFKRFNIEVLCTTDAATDMLEPHQQLQREGFPVRPTFRPDAVVNLQTLDWLEHIQKLSEVSGIDITGYQRFIAALEQRRSFFKTRGATATDHTAVTPDTEQLSPQLADEIFSRALQGKISSEDAKRFTAHMLAELARMSVDDGLIMQLHIGSMRDHNPFIFGRFGKDKGADIPVPTQWTQALRPLLQRFGNERDLRILLFCLDESSYARELATLAGHYPALRLGPPWWFFDSVKGMERYLDAVVETAGIYNLAGFNDDTRAFASIPARHDVWRRVTCNWLAGEVVKGLMAEDEASEVAHDLAYRLAKRAYKIT